MPGQEWLQAIIPVMVENAINTFHDSKEEMQMCKHQSKNLK